MSEESLTSQDKEELKRRLELLQKEYERTAQRLQRAERREAVRKHVQNTISEQNRLLRVNTSAISERSSSSPEQISNRSVPPDSTKVRFDLPDASPFSSLTWKSRSHRLRSKRSRLRLQIRERESDTEESQEKTREGTEERWREECRGNGEEKERDVEREQEEERREKTETLTDELNQNEEKLTPENHQSAAEISSANPSPLPELSEVHDPPADQSALRNSPSASSDHSVASDETSSQVCSVSAEEKPPAGSYLLNSCTLIEGLPFPVEYYIRTTRRMASAHSSVDLNAVIQSQLSNGRGRRRASRGRVPSQPAAEKPPERSESRKGGARGRRGRRRAREPDSSAQSDSIQEEPEPTLTPEPNLSCELSAGSQVYPIFRKRRRQTDSSHLLPSVTSLIRALTEKEFSRNLTVPVTIFDVQDFHLPDDEFGQLKLQRLRSSCPGAGALAYSAGFRRSGSAGVSEGAQVEKNNPLPHGASIERSLALTFTERFRVQSADQSEVGITSGTLDRTPEPVRLLQSSIANHTEMDPNRDTEPPHTLFTSRSLTLDLSLSLTSHTQIVHNPSLISLGATPNPLTVAHSPQLTPFLSLTPDQENEKNPEPSMEMKSSSCEENAEIPTNDVVIHSETRSQCQNDPPLPPNDPVTQNDPPLHHNDPVTQNGPPLHHNDLLTQNDPPLHHNDPVTQNDPLLHHNDPVTQNDPPLHHNDLLTQNDPPLHPNDLLTQNDHPLHHNDPVTQNDPPLHHNDPVTQNDPPLHHNDPVTQNYPPLHPNDLLTQNDHPLHHNDLLAQNDPPLHHNDLLTQNDSPLHPNDPVTQNDPPLHPNDLLTQNDPPLHHNDPVTQNDPPLHHNDLLTQNDPPLHHNDPVTQNYPPLHPNDLLTQNDPPLHHNDPVTQNDPPLHPNDPVSENDPPLPENGYPNSSESKPKTSVSDELHTVSKLDFLSQTRSRRSPQRDGDHILNRKASELQREDTSSLNFPLKTRQSNPQDSACPQGALLSGGSLRKTHSLKALDGGCVLDVCLVRWPPDHWCVCVAGEWSVCVWKQNAGVQQWKLLYTWTFTQSVISLQGVPDSSALLCVCLGRLEITEARVLCCPGTAREFSQTELYKGRLQAALAVSGGRVTCCSAPGAHQTVQVFTLCQEGRIAETVSLVSTDEAVQTLVLVEKETDALIGWTELQSLLIWNMKSGQLLQTIRLTDRVSTATCLRGYSYRGVVCVLLQQVSVCHEESGSVLFTLIATNPLTGRYFTLSSISPPSASSERLIDGDVCESALVGVFQSGLTIWNLTGGVACVHANEPAEVCRLARWAGPNTLLTGYLNGDVHIYQFNRTELRVLKKKSSENYLNIYNLFKDVK